MSKYRAIAPAKRAQTQVAAASRAAQRSAWSTRTWPFVAGAGPTGQSSVGHSFANARIAQSVAPRLDRMDVLQRETQSEAKYNPQEQIDKIIEGLKKRFDEAKHHGYWCGPGSKKSAASAEECRINKEITVDEADVCCCVHDKDYDQLGIGADGMWSEANMIKSIPADEKFVACLQGAKTSNDEYRQLAIILFQSRVYVATLLQAKNEFLYRVEQRIREFQNDVDEARRIFDNLLNDDAATWWWFIRRMSGG